MPAFTAWQSTHVRAFFQHGNHFSNRIVLPPLPILAAHANGVFLPRTVTSTSTTVVVAAAAFAAAAAARCRRRRRCRRCRRRPRPGRKLLDINTIFVITEAYEAFQDIASDDDDGDGGNGSAAAAAAAAATAAAVTGGSGGNKAKSSSSSKVSVAQLELLGCQVAYTFNWLCLNGGAPLCAAVAASPRTVALLLAMTVAEEQPADVKTGLRPPGRLNTPAAVDALEVRGANRGHARTRFDVVDMRRVFGVAGDRACDA